MIEELIDTLKTDSDYRHSWEANIAVAIMDTRRATSESLHAWRNRCAATFINRLCSLPEVDLPGMLALTLSVPSPEGIK